MPYTYKYPRPSVTTDIIINYNDEILLIKRRFEPFKDYWAIPGGFLDENESPIDAAARELEEETSITNVKLTQMKTYGDFGRDPRGHTISIVYFVIVDKKPNVKAQDDAAEAKWFSLNDLPNLAFDHNKIITDYKKMIN